MKFGVGFSGSPASIELIARAESLGYDCAWVGDTPTINSDPFVLMALAAGRTSTIKLGLGMAIPRMRLPHVLATAMGTLNMLAPGRLILGIGTGYTAAFTMGSKPSRWADVIDHVDVCRALLAGETAEMLVDGQRRPVKHLHPEWGFVNSADPVPIFIGAIGPKGTRLAGEHGDGLITFTANRPSPGELAPRIGTARTLARERGCEGFETVLLTAVGVREPNEPADSPRLRKVVGHWATLLLHGYSETLSDFDQAQLLPSVKAALQAYSRFEFRADAPYLERHRGHHLFVRPDEEGLLTADLLTDVAMVGTGEDLISEIRALENVGVTQIYWHLGAASPDELDRFAESVINPYRRIMAAQTPHA